MLSVYALSGCGGGSGSTVGAVKAVPRTQQFYGVNVSAAAYTLDKPVDQSKSVDVTVGGATLAQGTGYFIDKTFPNVVHLNNPVPTTTLVVIQYTPQATDAGK